MRIAALADIHGNAFALAAVIADLERREANVRERLNTSRTDGNASVEVLADYRAHLAISRRLASELEREVDRLAQPNESDRCVCEDAYPRLRPIVETMQDQLTALDTELSDHRLSSTDEGLYEEVLHLVIRQVNQSPGMFLQPGFLCDVIVNDHKNGEARLYKDIRTDYVLNSWIAEEEDFYTVSLEYGHFLGDPFSVERDPAPDIGHEAAYLHPVIRRFNKKTQIAEHHINDDLESAWYKDI